jgi:hypothetical protein
LRHAGTRSWAIREGGGTKIDDSANETRWEASSSLPGSVFLALLLSVSCAAWGQDLEREGRLADQIVDSIMDGEPVTLQAGDLEFLGIYTESENSPPRGGAIVLHGRGFHPNWDEVVYPVRTTLPAHGWSTLSLQMPVLGKEAKYYDYVPILPTSFPRIGAGIAFLRERNVTPIVIIAHSCSVHMTMAYVDAFGDGDFDAYVGIGMGATDYGQPMKRPFPLARMRVPVLDLYGEEEYPAVLRMGPERAAAMAAAGNALSRQVTVPGADHYFKGKDDELTAALLAWLETLPD